MMMAKNLSSALTLALALALNGANAQTIAEERSKIDQHNQQIATLQQANSDIETQAAELGRKIDQQARKYEPEEQARNQAEARYRAALKAADNTPSIPNRERADTARFQFLMAERKYQRLTQDVHRLRKQQKALQTKLASNQKKISAANAGIEQQQEQILALEQQARKQTSQQARKERQLRLKQEGELRSSQSELHRAREKHAAALAEIAALKAQLAEKQAAANKPAVSVATLQTPCMTSGTVRKNTISPPPTSSPSAQTNTERDASSAGPMQGDRQQYYDLLTAAREEKRSQHRVNKILHMKTYISDRVTKQTSHSLKHLGNGIYEGKTVIRAGATAFVIGSKQWKQTIPPGDHRQRYVFVLDARDKAKPELLLFARSDIE